MCRSSTLIVFGSQSVYHGCRTPGCVYVSAINTHNFGRFWSASCTITHCFGVPERFPRLTITWVRLCVRCQHSKFWPILARYVDYYSRFWGPKAFSMVVEPQGVLTCPSSTLKVLADSGPFHGLLLTVLGSRGDIHDYRAPGCAHVSDIKTHRFLVPKRFRCLSNPKVRLRVGHQQSQFGLILARSNFHD